MCFFVFCITIIVSCYALSSFLMQCFCSFYANFIFIIIYYYNGVLIFCFCVSFYLLLMRIVNSGKDTANLLNPNYLFLTVNNHD